MTTLQLDTIDGSLIITLKRGKANAIDPVMVQEIRECLVMYADDPSVQGLLITGNTSFFSAGVDLPTVCSLSEIKQRSFWRDFIMMAAELLIFPKPVISAISGYSPAGGCIIACCSDFRYMARHPKFQIGLNEIAVGIAPRASILDLYASCIPRKLAYQYLLQGKLISGEEAERIGLVDALIDPSELTEYSIKNLKKLQQLPQNAFKRTKTSMRQELFDKLTRTIDHDLDALMQQIFSDECRTIMKAIIDKLTSK